MKSLTFRVQLLVDAFAFVIKNETYSVNSAALDLQRELDKGFATAIHTVMWNSVSSILTHSANLSKIFWPQPGRQTSADMKYEMQLRGEVLRSIFKVGNDSPLRSRAIRNRFEHLDEDLHGMTIDDDTIVVDQFIGTKDELNKLEKKLVWRSFDYQTGIVSVGNKEVGLKPLIYECDRIYELWRLLKKPPSPAA